MCSHMRFCSGFPYCQTDQRQYTLLFQELMLLLGAPIDAPITKQTVPSLEAVFWSDTCILELDQPTQSFREQYHVTSPILESRGTRTLLCYCSCTTLIHSRTCTSTIPRAEFVLCTLVLIPRLLESVGR